MGAEPVQIHVVSAISGVPWDEAWNTRHDCCRCSPCLVLRQPGLVRDHPHQFLVHGSAPCESNTVDRQVVKAAADRMSEVIRVICGDPRNQTIRA